MKLLKKDLSNPIGVGDFVEFEPESENQGIIHKIEPRKNYIVRQSPKNKHQLHLIAANIDLAVLVTTLIQPTFKPGFIDRFLITTEPQNIPVLIVFNKSDLWKESEFQLFEDCKSIYRHITAGLLEVSTVTLKNIELLTGLIWLNIAPLHDDKFSKFIFSMGKYKIYEVLNESI